MDILTLKNRDYFVKVRVLLLYYNVDHWQNHYKPNTKIMATMVIHISHISHVDISTHFSKNDGPEINIMLVIGKFHFNSLKMRQKFVPGQTTPGNRIQESQLSIFCFIL